MASRIAIALVWFATAFLPACGDDGPTPVDAAMPLEAGACVGTVPYLEDCEMDLECDSCICRTFGHSKVCTKECTTNADCPAPSAGCTSDGLCRP